MNVSDNPTCEVIAHYTDGARVWAVDQWGQAKEVDTAASGPARVALDKAAVESFPTNPLSEQELRRWAWEQARQGLVMGMPAEFEETEKIAERLIQWVKGEE